MRKAGHLTTLLGTAIILSACVGDYQPVVDMKGVNHSKYQQDLAECRNYADQVDIGGNTATNALVGAGAGAASGAILGAITGSPGTGAAIGAAVGGIGGAGGTAARDDVRQKNIINKCLKGRGYKVLG